MDNFNYLLIRKKIYDALLSRDGLYGDSNLPLLKREFNFARVKITNPRNALVNNLKDNFIAENKPEQLTSESLFDLEKLVENCELCQLSKSRKNTVFGEGDANADVFVVGEAPGANEDLEGRVFVGKAGQLLTKMLLAIDLKREACFISNVLKCRPPFNRDPNPDEIQKCAKFLDKQIEIVKPKVILALGRIAAQRLLNVEKKMFEFRNSKNFYKGIPLLVTYHPSALLRNEQWKRYAWEDLKRLRNLLNNL